jgi:diaminohydroxyphosphoribosylaminopyrimidine deaminase / 5-amino-6-(5-phosphoribosylamino)uracil reductase
MTFTAPDDELLRAALRLARRSIGLSDPNPRVGCVVVGAGWRAEGFTQEAGGPHAEIVALRAARDAGHDPRGSTVFVTLEPCAHHGRTPPCCDALVDAGVARVVVAVGDPNPLVAGQGLARLRAAGIAVEMADEAVAREARALNIGFFSRMQRGRPWVRMKVAASLDGRTALANGVSQWITGEAARADGHAWRKRAGAVLTGIGTVLEDDPRLDVRHVATARQPLRVVVDARLQTPPTARLLAPPGAVLIYTAADGPAADALRARGAELRPARRPRQGRSGGHARRPRRARHQRAARRGRSQAQRIAAAHRPRRRAAGLPGAQADRARPRDGRARPAGPARRRDTDAVRVGRAHRRRPAHRRAAAGRQAFVDSPGRPDRAAAVPAGRARPPTIPPCPSPPSPSWSPSSPPVAW